MSNARTHHRRTERHHHITFAGFTPGHAERHHHGVATHPGRSRSLIERYRKSLINSSDLIIRKVDRRRKAQAEIPHRPLVHRRQAPTHSRSHTRTSGCRPSGRRARRYGRTPHTRMAAQVAQDIGWRIHRRISGDRGYRQALPRLASRTSHRPAEPALLSGVHPGGRHDNSLRGAAASAKSRS